MIDSACTNGEISHGAQALVIDDNGYRTLKLTAQATYAAGNQLLTDFLQSCTICNTPTFSTASYYWYMTGIKLLKNGYYSLGINKQYSNIPSNPTYYNANHILSWGAVMQQGENLCIIYYGENDPTL